MGNSRRAIGDDVRERGPIAIIGTSLSAGRGASQLAMCGIAGVMNWSERGDINAVYSRTQAMVEALAHRGPDGRGAVLCQPSGKPAADDGPVVGLGHTRLAIIDLSERGAQPMRSATHPLWITFNGEIFNFRSVRAD